MKATKGLPIEPSMQALQQLFALSDSCMHLLSANAWKVVSYVASQCLRLYPENLQPSLMTAIERHLDQIAPDGSLTKPRGKDDRPYRPVQTEFGETKRFAMLSLEQMRKGVRDKRRRFRDHGTGLSKSSAAEAINEAIRAGVLIRRRQRSSQGRDLCSLYWVNWDRVLELDWMRKKGRRTVRQADPNLGVSPVDTK